MRPQVACLLLLFTTAFAAKDSSEDFDIENLRESEWSSLDEDQDSAPTNDNEQAIREALENYIKNRQKNPQQSNVPPNSFTLNSPLGAPSFSPQTQEQNTPFTFDTSSLQQPQLSQGNFNVVQQNNRPGLELFVNKPLLTHSNVAQFLNQPQLNQNNPTFTTLSSRQQQGPNIAVNSNLQFAQSSVSQNLNQQQFNPKSQGFVPLNSAQQFSQQNVAPFETLPNFKQGSRVQFLNSPQSEQIQFSSQQTQFAPNTASLLSGNYGTLLNQNTANLQDSAPPPTKTHTVPPEKDEHVIDVKDFLNYLQNNGAEDGEPTDKDPPTNPKPALPPPSGPEPKPSPPAYPQDVHSPESFLLKDTAEYMIARDNKGKPILLSDVEENGNIPTHMDYNLYAPAASTQVNVNALVNGKFENLTKEKQDSQYFDLFNVQNNGKFETISQIKHSSTFVPDFISKQVHATEKPKSEFYGSQQYGDNIYQSFSPSSQNTIQQFYDTRADTPSFKANENLFLQNQDKKPATGEISKLSTNFPTTGHFLGNGPSTNPISQSGQQGPLFLDQSKLIQVNTPENFKQNLEHLTTNTGTDYATSTKPESLKDNSQGSLSNTQKDFYVDFTVTQIQDKQKTSLHTPSLSNEQLNPATTSSFLLQNRETNFEYKPQVKNYNSEDFSQLPDFLYNYSHNTKDSELKNQDKLKLGSQYAKEQQSFTSNQPPNNPSDITSTKISDGSFTDFGTKSYFRTQNNPNNENENLNHQIKTTKAISQQDLGSNSNRPQEQTFYDKLRQAMSKTETTTSNIGSFGTTVPIQYTSNTAPGTLPLRTTTTATTQTNGPPTEYFTTSSNFPETDFVTTNYPSTLQLTTIPYSDKFTTLPHQPLTDKVTPQHNIQTTDIFTTTFSSSPEKFTTSTRPSTDRFTTGSNYPNTLPFTTSPNNPLTTSYLTTVLPSISETEKATLLPHIPTTTSQSFTGDGEQGLPSYNIPGLPLQISGQQNIISNYPPQNLKPLQDFIIKPPNKKAPVYTNSWLKNNYMSSPIVSDKNDGIKVNQLSDVELLHKPFLDPSSSQNQNNSTFNGNYIQKQPQNSYVPLTDLQVSVRPQSDFSNFYNQASYFSQLPLPDNYNAAPTNYNKVPEHHYINKQSDSHYSNIHYTPFSDSPLTKLNSSNVENSFINNNNYLSAIYSAPSSSFFLKNENKKQNVVSISHGNHIPNNPYINAQSNKFPHFEEINSHNSGQQNNPNNNHHRNNLQDFDSQAKRDNFNNYATNLHYSPLSDLIKDNTRGPYRPNNLYDKFENLMINEPYKNLKPIPDPSINNDNNQVNTKLYGYANVPNSFKSKIPHHDISVINTQTSSAQKHSDSAYKNINNQNKLLSDSPVKNSDILNVQNNQYLYQSNRNTQNNPHLEAQATKLNEPNTFNLKDANGQSTPLTHPTNTHIQNFNADNRQNLNKNYYNFPNIPLSDSSNLNSQYTQNKPSYSIQSGSIGGNLDSEIFSNKNEASFNYNNYNVQNTHIPENLNNFASAGNIFSNHHYTVPNNQDNTQYLNIQYNPVSDYGNFNAQTSVSIQAQHPNSGSNFNGQYVLASSQNNYQQSPSLSQPVFISSTNGFYPNGPNHVLLTPQNPAHNHDVSLHAQNNSPLAPGQQPVSLNDTPGLNVPQGYPQGQFLQVQNLTPGQNNIPQQGYNANIPTQFQPLVQSDTPIIPGFNAVEAFEKEDLTPVYLPADNCSAVFEVLEDRQSVLGVRALPGNADCRITFTSPKPSRLAMQVLGLDLPQGDNACSAASISVFSQRDGRNMLLNQLCGEVKESPVMLTEGQSALVTVQSEAGTTRPGFTIVAFLW